MKQLQSCWRAPTVLQTAASCSAVPLWPVSPSAGWRSGVDTATGLPNGGQLGVAVQKPYCRERIITPYHLLDSLVLPRYVYSLCDLD